MFCWSPDLFLLIFCNENMMNTTIARESILEFLIDTDHFKLFYSNVVMF